jgi:hypothetical protein
MSTEDSQCSEFENVNYWKPSSSGGLSPRGRRPRKFQIKSTFDRADGGNFAMGGKSKRSRSLVYQVRYANSDATPLPVQKIEQLAINDEAEVQQFYFARFDDMSQSACKVIAKAFVKLVEPKKQTHYPYIKGDIKAPPWWPDTKGESSVGHKEPDHLSKPGGLHCGAIQAAQV